jgi:predicted transcriptional regulator
MAKTKKEMLESIAKGSCKGFMCTDDKCPLNDFRKKLLSSVCFNPRFCMSEGESNLYPQVIEEAKRQLEELEMNTKTKELEILVEQANTGWKTLL